MAEINELDEAVDDLRATIETQRNIIHELINELAGIRQDLEPILSGEIERGNCSTKRIEPGMRKTKMADARKIVERVHRKIFKANQENKINPLHVVNG